MLAFVVFSPWNALNDLIGWDPRLPWSFFLALRACLEGWKSKRFRFPPLAIWSFCAFVLVAGLGLVFETERVLQGDVVSAAFLFLYLFVCCVTTYCIVQLTHRA